MKLDQIFVIGFAFTFGVSGEFVGTNFCQFRRILPMLFSGALNFHVFDSMNSIDSSRLPSSFEMLEMLSKESDVAKAERQLIEFSTMINKYQNELIQESFDNTAGLALSIFNGRTPSISIGNALQYMSHIGNTAAARAGDIFGKYKRMLAHIGSKCHGPERDQIETSFNRVYQRLFNVHFQNGFKMAINVIIDTISGRFADEKVIEKAIAQGNALTQAVIYQTFKEMNVISIEMLRCQFANGGHVEKEATTGQKWSKSIKDLKEIFEDGFGVLDVLAKAGGDQVKILQLEMSFAIGATFESIRSDFQRSHKPTNIIRDMQKELTVLERETLAIVTSTFGHNGYDGQIEISKALREIAAIEDILKILCSEI